MALRDKLAEKSQPLLEAGETIRTIFPGRSGPNPNLVLLTWLTNFFSKYWIVAKTDRRVVVLAVKSMMQVTTPVSIAAQFPAETRLGPTSGALFSQLNITVESKRVWVHRRFYKDVETADAA